MPRNISTSEQHALNINIGERAKMHGVIVACLTKPPPPLHHKLSVTVSPIMASLKYMAHTVYMAGAHKWAVQKYI